MRTTLNVDNMVLDEVVRLTGEKNKSKAVNKVLEDYLRRKTDRRAEGVGRQDRSRRQPQRAGGSRAQGAGADTVVIADSNIWINYLRRPHQTVGLELENLIDDERVLMVGVVLAEILQGSRGEAEYAALLPRLGVFPYREMSQATWAKVGEIAAHLRRLGQITPLTDLSIAALALEGNHEVFSLDQHFERVPGLTLYQPKDE